MSEASASSRCDPMTNGNISFREEQSRAIFYFKRRFGRLWITKYGNAALVNRVVNVSVMMDRRVFLCLDKERLALYEGIKEPVGPGRVTVSF